MLTILLGVAALVLFLYGVRAFSRASVASVKSLLAWVAALGGLSLTLLLILTGRGPIALFALSFALPLLRDWWQARRPGLGARRPNDEAGSREGRSAAGRQPRGAMSREEALAILGLGPGATEEDIRAAHRRLMRAAHPDSGGSDWLASRINQARDRLLG